MKIIPTVLTDNLEEFKRQMEAAESFSDEIDIDVLDGSLFSGKTLTLEEMLSVETNLVRHLHLMVKNPADYIKSALYYGVRTIVVHAEADLEWVNFNEIPADMGIALAPETPLSDITSDLANVDVVQVMTVEPGKQGNTFLSDQIQKIKELKDMKYGFEVKVDGSVNQNTITEIEAAGADTAVVGSEIWSSEDPREAYRALQEIVQNN